MAVHLIITMIKWVRTSRLPIKNSLCASPTDDETTSARQCLVIQTKLLDARIWVQSSAPHI